MVHCVTKVEEVAERVADAVCVWKPVKDKIEDFREWEEWLEKKEEHTKSEEQQRNMSERRHVDH